MNITKEDACRILGVSEDSSSDEVRSSYKRLALKWHPDKHGDSHKDEATQKFQEVSAAYKRFSTNVSDGDDEIDDSEFMNVREWTELFEHIFFHNGVPQWCPTQRESLSEEEALKNARALIEEEELEKMRVEKKKAKRKKKKEKKKQREKEKKAEVTSAFINSLPNIAPKIVDVVAPAAHSNKRSDLSPEADISSNVGLSQSNPCSDAQNASYNFSSEVNNDSLDPDDTMYDQEMGDEPASDNLVLGNGEISESDKSKLKDLMTVMPLPATENKDLVEQIDLGKNSSGDIEVSKVPNLELNEFRRKIFVGGLNRETTENSFRKYFRQFGKTVFEEIVRDPATRSSRGFGFITYDASDAVESIFHARPHIIDGKRLDVKRAWRKEGKSYCCVCNRPMPRAIFVKKAVAERYPRYDKIQQTVLSRYPEASGSRIPGPVMPTSKK